MEQFVQKVNAILEEAFPGIEAAIGIKKGIRRATGFVVWSGFVGKAQIERQSQIWNVLRKNLTQNEQLNLGTILTLTPHEVAAMEEVAAAA